MRVGILGINHKLADLKLREYLAKICHRRLNPGQSTHGEHSFVLLSTCNRTEIYFSSQDLARTHSYLLSILRQEVSEDFDQKLYSFFGQDCLIHLCRVAAGLDSAIVAETEIQGQVKGAYEIAQEYCRLPFELHYLFQNSLKIAKKTRTVLPSKSGLPDIEHAVFQTGQNIFTFQEEVKILLVGASAINEKVLAYFKSRKLKNISLCNRSQASGEFIAEKYQISCVDWEAVAKWHEYDWIIIGTKSPDYLISNKILPSKNVKKKLIIDLSVPRNVDPALACPDKITLLNIDQINRQLQIRKKKMLLSLKFAEEFISHASIQQIKLFQEKEKNRQQICAISA